MKTGESAPLGASMRRNGVNFSVYSRSALGMELLLFDRADDRAEPHGQPDWGPGSRSIAFTAELQSEKMLLHLILNAYWEPLEFELPQGENGASWRRWIDTALASPRDIVPWQESPAIPGRAYRAEARSVVVLLAQPGPG